MSKPPISIPWALTPDGDLVRADVAKKGGKYSCADPSCGADLVPHQGPVRQWHYQHRAGEGACIQESLEHWTAKYLLAQVVNDPERRTQIRVETAARCGHTERLPLPTGITHARVESTELLEWHVQPDVLIRGAKVPIALEVLNTHAVGSSKRDFYAAAGVRWVELVASAILKDPIAWHPVAVSQPRKSDCNACQENERRTRAERQRAEDELRLLAERWGLSWSSTEVRPKRWTCWARECGEVILVFAWPPYSPWNQRPPPEPRPRTVRWSQTEKVPNGYFANTCPGCRRVQGDWSLYFHADGPFFGSQPIDDDEDR